MTEEILELSDAPPVSLSIRDATMTTSCISSTPAAISSSVKPFSRITDARGEDSFHERVDILALRIDSECTALQICKDSFKSGNDLVTVILGQNALCREHSYMCDAAADILTVHPLVKRYRGIKVVNCMIFFFGETSTP